MIEKKWERVLVVAPDCLTWSRLLLGLMIGLAGPLFGRKGMELVTILLLVGWTTDILDGRLARSAQVHYGRLENWTGRNEIRFDSIMLVGALTYLAYTLSPWFGVWALLLFFLALLPVSYSKIFLFEAPAAMATFVLMAALTRRTTLEYVITWALLVLIYDWKRAMELGGKLRKLLGLVARRIIEFFTRTF